MIASMNGHAKAAELLISYGANINICRKYYGTALHAAAAHGREKAVKMLLENNIDSSIKDEVGRYIRPYSTIHDELYIFCNIKEDRNKNNHCLFHDFFFYVFIILYIFIVAWTYCDR